MFNRQSGKSLLRSRPLISCSIALGLIGFQLPVIAQNRPNTSNSEPITVPRSTFDCLVRDIDRIAKKKGRARSIRVDMRDCRLRTSPSGFGPEEVLELDDAEIACIRKFKMRISQIVVVVGDYYRIDLKRCAKPPA